MATADKNVDQSVDEVGREFVRVPCLEIERFLAQEGSLNPCPIFAEHLSDSHADFFFRARAFSPLASQSGFVQPAGVETLA